MTDKEIIKALECCKELSDCGGCQYGYLRTHNGLCIYKMQKDALDLIDRQQAELDDLKRDTIPKLQDSLKRANKYGLETDKENEQLKAEIERLNSCVKSEDEVRAIANATIQAGIKIIKAEAIKEYKEKLREHAYLDSGITGFQEMVVDLSDIENIAEEMVGEGK